MNRAPAFKRYAMNILLLLALLAALLVTAQLFQDRLIYFPRSYPITRDSLPPSLQLLEYQTSSGAQVAFYLPPRENEPRRIWFVFGGNATLALEWQSWLQATLADGDAALLFDYPGFGFNNGRANAASIDEASQAAFTALAAHLKLPAATLQDRLAILGHSIGAAAALQLAQRHPPRRLVLLAPFTSLRAEAQAVYGAWVGPFVRNEYDNVAALRRLDPAQTSVHVLHGQNDNIIPARFSRELKAQFPWLHYQEIAGADHNDLLSHANPALSQLLRYEEE